jgi:uncharacterized protein YegP (UPF0339 family)
MTFYMYKDVQGYWRWYLEAANGRKVATSGEGYNNEQDCLHAIGLVMDTNRSTPLRKR